MIIAFINISIDNPRYGPYHHEALVDVSYNVKEYDDNTYCLLNNSLYELTDGTMTAVDLDTSSDEWETYNIYATDFEIYNDKFYIANSVISCFTLDGELLSANIYPNFHFGCVDYIFIIDDVLLISSWNGLYSYNLITEELELIDEVFKNKTYKINNHRLYINNAGRIFDCECIQNTNLAYKTYNHFSELIEIELFDFNITIYDNGLNLIFKYNDIEYMLEADSKIRFCNMFKIVDNNIYFSYYDYIRDLNNCNDEKCYCQFGSSKVYKFNLETKELSLVKEFLPGSFLIEVNSENIVYYKDSNIYINDLSVKQVDEIKIGEEYYNNSETSSNFTNISFSYFCFYNERIYSLYYNFSFIL